MREIKFRAWCKERTCMFPEYGAIAKIDLKPCGGLRGIGVAEYRQIDEEGNGDWDLFEVLNDKENNLVLMQYTGLKDKDGKEIYEGDILNYSDMIFPVTVSDYHGYRFMFGADCLCKAFAHYGEIVGNIYENPELLEGE